ncbi:tagaturonate reductase [Bacillus sp. JCM 19041]|uniref:tagaturonate reductase n=1 Tax=Bacillus sp. JCM 19041 TaxID=1460637 RepID=UPI0006D224F1
MAETDVHRLTKTVLHGREHTGEETIVQIGEGNFLRGFLNWMIHQLHKQDVYSGRVVAIQPTPHGKVVPVLNAQDGLYTTILRGKQDGETVDKAELVQSISRGINPYTDWNKVIALAASPAVKWLFSNTTEAGLTYLHESYTGEEAPLTFPGKTTAFLYERFLAFDGSLAAGIVVVPCELVEENGAVLKGLIKRVARDWELPEAFFCWLDEAIIFCNTLVDRIVTGFPLGEEAKWATKLGYEDQLLTVAEPYHLFVIEAERMPSECIPFTKAGLNVVWEKTAPYRDLKVRLLNGAHTFLFAAAVLAGETTVKGALENQVLRRFLERGMQEELMPTVRANQEVKEAYVASVIERFENPYLAHQLTDIGMNAVYKFKTRLLPALQANQRSHLLLFSLAALLVYMKPTGKEGAFLQGQANGKPYTIRENEETLTILNEVWGQFDQEKKNVADTVQLLLEQEELWGDDLSCHRIQVTAFVEQLLSGEIEAIIATL